MTISWRGPLLVLSLVGVLAIAGCGSDDNDSSSTGTAAASTQAAASDDGGGSATTEDAGSDDSGGGSDDEFCTKLQDIGKNLQDQGASMSDPQKLGEFAEQVEDALNSADPPAELKEDWDTLTSLFATLAKVMKNADFSDPSSLVDLQDDLQEFQNKADQLSSATTALSQYAAEHCGGAFS